MATIKGEVTYSARPKQGHSRISSAQGYEIVEPNFINQHHSYVEQKVSTTEQSEVSTQMSHTLHQQVVINQSSKGSEADIVSDLQAGPCSSIELTALDESCLSGHPSSAECIIHHHAQPDDGECGKKAAKIRRAKKIGSSSHSTEKVIKKKTLKAFSLKPVKLKKEYDPDNVAGVKKRFCASWFAIPEIAPWLEESILPNHAYCKFCQKDLTAGKSELYKHLKTVKHRKKAEFYGMAAVSSAEEKHQQFQCDVPTSHGITPEHNGRSKTCVAGPSTPVLLRPVPVAHPLPSRKFQIYLADDMHVPQSKEVLAAAYNTHQEVHNKGRVKELEHRAAQLLGKEAAVFVLTGTMANTLAVLAHCFSSDSAVLVGDRSHIYRQCQTTLTRLHHVNLRVLRNTSDGRVNLDDLHSAMLEGEEGGESEEEGDEGVWRGAGPRPGLLCIENTHTYSGGMVLPEHYMLQVQKACEQHGLLLHLDGARLLHAAYHTDRSPAALAAPAFSVALGLDKGLDARNGAVLASSKEFVMRCRELLSLFCVSSMETESMAAACSKALSHYVQHVARAHQHAKTIFKALTRLNSSAVTLHTDEPSTNMILLECDCVRVTPQHLVQRLRQMPQTEISDLKERTSIVTRVWSHNTVRLVTHSGLTPEQIAAALKKLKYVIEEYDNFLVLEYNVVEGGDG